MSFAPSLQHDSLPSDGALFCGMEDAQFTAMETAFRAHGGLLHGDDVADLMRERLDQPISLLAKWIATRRIIAIEHRFSMLLPMFQFELARMELRSGCCAVVAELRDVMTDWEVALWFATANARLFGLMPVDVLAFDSRAVLNAAGVDRFCVKG